MRNPAGESRSSGQTDIPHFPRGKVSPRGRSKLDTVAKVHFNTNVTYDGISDVLNGPDKCLFVRVPNHEQIDTVTKTIISLVKGKLQSAFLSDAWPAFATFAGVLPTLPTFSTFTAFSGMLSFLEDLTRIAKVVRR